VTTIRKETEHFLADLRRFANRQFVYDREIGDLLDEARTKGMMQVFEDLIFVAKFLSKSFDLLGRIGPDGEGYGKISAEFQANLEKANTYVKTLAKESPEPLKQHMVDTFLRLDHESMAAFMALVRELAWVKNWTLDGKPLP